MKKKLGFLRCRWPSWVKKRDRENITRSIALKGNNKFVLDSYTHNTVMNATSKLDIDYEFTLDLYHTTVGNEIYVNPHLKKYLQNEFIKEGVRMANFSKFAMHYVNVNCIFLPNKATVTAMPKDVILENEDLYFSCTYTMKENNMIEVVEEVKVKNRKIPEERFEAYNKLIAQANKIYKETVTITNH